MFSTQAVVIIWGDGVANYIVMVIIAQCTSNHHVVHPKPAQRYVLVMSQYSQRHKAGESPPLLRTYPSFSALSHVLTERRLPYIYFTNKPKILLGVLWKGHFAGSALRASDSWCEWTQNILIQSGGGPGFSGTRNTQHWARSFCAALFWTITLAESCGFIQSLLAAVWNR